jgi:hypothetical protein
MSKQRRERRTWQNRDVVQQGRHDGAAAVHRALAYTERHAAGLTGQNDLAAVQVRLHPCSLVEHKLPGTREGGAGDLEATWAGSVRTFQNIHGGLEVVDGAPALWGGWCSRREIIDSPLLMTKSRPADTISSRHGCLTTTR